jgi:UDP-glucose 4-epimerase|tara:strand:- start:722 stop:1642 length:921 start_codon:yes stop_codon:yes gene_type:complete
MRCIVTGGAGFIGSNLVDKLIDEGHEVIIFDNLSTGQQKNINPKAKFFLIDIAHQPYFENKTMKDIMSGVDVVFHLAALARVQPSIENPIEYHNTNINGTLNMLDACRKYGVKRFVFSSSSSVYGDVREEDLPTSENSELNPMSPYALHKLVGEQYCKLYSELYGLETVSLRYFNVYGERQPIEGAYTLVMGVFAQQRLNGEKMTIRGDGEQRRDFTYVGDVVEANIKCMEYPLELNGDILNVGNGDNKSVNDIADLIGGERVNLEPVIEPRVTLADNTKIKKLLDWKPTQDLNQWVGKWVKDLGI